MSNVVISFEKKRWEIQLQKIFDNFSRGNYSIVNDLEESELINFLWKIKITKDAIRAFIDVFFVVENPDIKKELAIAIIYYSLGSAYEVWMFLHSSKVPQILSYLALLDEQEFDRLLLQKHIIDWVSEKEQLLRIPEVIQTWKRLKAIPIRVSGIYKSGTSVANYQ